MVDESLQSVLLGCTSLQFVVRNIEGVSTYLMGMNTLGMLNQEGFESCDGGREGPKFS